MKQTILVLEQHILEQQRAHPGASGEFSWLLSAITLATRVISAHVRRAGLVDILGETGATNVQGEIVQKLDVIANETIATCLGYRDNVGIMVSEEDDNPRILKEPDERAKYIVLFDPLDGSSNIDVNVSIGTIFSIHRAVSGHERGHLTDCLQRGRSQLAAGYVVYGSSTMLVYSSGAGVHGFTLDPGIGEFLLSHPDIRMPTPPSRTYSVNEAYYPRWSEGQKLFLDHLKGSDGDGYSTRYIGSLVADFHRTLLRGGIFMYPADRKNPKGKLRLLYEAAPLAFIAEKAGGRASDGVSDILDLEPCELHERTPLYIGSSELVALAEDYLAKNSEF